MYIYIYGTQIRKNNNNKGGKISILKGVCLCVCAHLRVYVCDISRGVQM